MTLTRYIVDIKERSEYLDTRDGLDDGGFTVSDVTNGTCSTGRVSKKDKKKGESVWLVMFSCMQPDWSFRRRETQHGCLLACVGCREKKKKAFWGRASRGLLLFFVVFFLLRLANIFFDLDRRFSLRDVFFSVVCVVPCEDKIQSGIRRKYRC